VHWAQILDVNLNRFNESLKFIEDIIRFFTRDKHLLVKVRKMRIDFLKIKKALPLTDIIRFRESQHDLGRHALFDIQIKKSSSDIIMANFTRAKESSRMLEEIFKSQNAQASKKMKEIRFRIYDLEKDVLQSLKRKFTPRLYAIIDEKYIKPNRLRESVTILEDNGATMIQLRIKTLSDRKFFNYALKIKKAIRDPKTKFIINNRTDIALACHADGVHLGQHDMPVKMARNLLGEEYIVGASAHNIKEARLAEAQGADYIGVGSLFKTKTKPDAHLCSLSVFKSICKNITIPVVGIGGITNKNYRAVLRAGASGIAVCSYLFEGDLRKNIRSLTRGKL